jgi:hypothetical protein
VNRIGRRTIIAMLLIAAGFLLTVGATLYATSNECHGPRHTIGEVFVIMGCTSSR